MVCSTALGNFLSALDVALAGHVVFDNDNDAAMSLREKIVETLNGGRSAPPLNYGPTTNLTDGQPRFDVATMLDQVSENISPQQPVLHRVIDKFILLMPYLSWRARVDYPGVSSDFIQGHANCIIVGPGGVDARSDVIVGASVLSPMLSYPNHQHAPEELYLVLSSSEWYNVDKGWYRPGIGSVIYHRSDIIHAMRSGAEPLFAIWCLA